MKLNKIKKEYKMKKDKLKSRNKDNTATAKYQG